MKVTAPDDLQGRLIACTNRVKLVRDTLTAFAERDSSPERDSLDALSCVGGVR